MFKLYDEERTLLMIPGPVEVHPRVLRAMSKPIYGHRTGEFRDLLNEVVNMLKPIFGTKNDIIILTGSGTLAMEAAVRTFVWEGKKVLSLVNGKFGERFSEIAKTTGAKVRVLEIPWGKAIKPEDVENALSKEKDVDVVTITHNETSTGVLNPLEEIAKVVKDFGAFLIVDGITSVGGDYVFLDKWKLDVVVAGSQKCLGIPPGLSFVALGNEALEMLEEGNVSDRAYYSNLKIYYDAWKKKGDLPFTGAVSLIYALYESLKMIHEEGLENRIRRHRLSAKVLREGLKAMGLRIFAEEGYESNTVTSVLYPNGISDNDFRKKLRDYGILVAAGQEHLKGKIFRLSTMNLVGIREILTTLSVIELVLKEMGFNVSKSGVPAAIDTYLSSK